MLSARPCSGLRRGEYDERKQRSNIYCLSCSVGVRRAYQIIAGRRARRIINVSLAGKGSASSKVAKPVGVSQPTNGGFRINPAV